MEMFECVEVKDVSLTVVVGSGVRVASGGMQLLLRGWSSCQPGHRVGAVKWQDTWPILSARGQGYKLTLSILHTPLDYQILHWVCVCTHMRVLLYTAGCSDGAF